MIVCGCDVGSMTTKAVIMEGPTILSGAVSPTTARPKAAAETVIHQALSRAAVDPASVALTVGTGYGQDRIAAAGAVRSEIACHAKAAKWLLPTVKMVIDIGGQDAKAIKVDAVGDIQRYAYNDACASGTGRFLEVMSMTLGVPLAEMGDRSLQSRQPIKLSSQCAVFAETEVITLINEGYPLDDILGGLHQALTRRVVSLARSIVLEEDITFTGGVAKNNGVFLAMEKALGVRLKKMDMIDPQLTGAVGAALFATEQLAGRLPVFDADRLIQNCISGTGT
jgi:predicted CoA-substrate-specific enzyme activase